MLWVNGEKLGNKHLQQGNICDKKEKKKRLANKKNKTKTLSNSPLC